MITFRKIEDAWGLQSDVRLEVGALVTVSLKSGASKQAVVGAFVAEQYGRFVYRIAEQKREVREHVAVGNLSAILALFDKAATHLKYPAIVLSVPALNETIRVNIAGQQANVPGSLNVTSFDKAEDGRRRWFGRVHRDGNFEKRNGTADAIAARLAEFAADPVKVATEHGRLTGRCCFCNLRLTDERSTAVGYGAICADHFGLAWGSRPTNFGEAA